MKLDHQRVSISYTCIYKHKISQQIGGSLPKSEFDSLSSNEEIVVVFYTDCLLNESMTVNLKLCCPYNLE